MSAWAGAGLTILATVLLCLGALLILLAVASMVFAVKDGWSWRAIPIAPALVATALGAAIAGFGVVCNWVAIRVRMSGLRSAKPPQKSTSRD